MASEHAARARVAGGPARDRHRSPDAALAPGHPGQVPCGRRSNLRAIPGGQVRLKEADSSTVVQGSISEWQEWTGMYFGDSGDYVVDGALSPVTINLENDMGEYVEPNVWILHLCS